MTEQRPKPWRRGERLTADRLNQMIGLGVQNPSTFAGLRWFEAQEAFAATEDVYSGACKELWLSGTSYTTRGDDIDVYSRSALASGSQFCAMWNVQSGRWEQISGGGSCSTQIRILIMGRPTGGTVTLPVTVNGSTENVIINYDDNATDLETAFEGHSEISPGQIVGNSMGGQLPFQELWITFDNGLSASDVTIGNATDALTGGFAMYSVIRKCCG